MLRPAGQDDFDFIKSISSRPENARFLSDDPVSDLQAWVDDSDTVLLIWEHEGRPEGYALFGDLLNLANRTELRRLGLSTPGAGLGRAFMQDLVNYAFASLGVNRLWLDVACDNPRARQAYLSAGFTSEGIFRSHWKNREGDIVDLEIFSILRPEWAG